MAGRVARAPGWVARNPVGSSAGHAHAQSASYWYDRARGSMAAQLEQPLQGNVRGCQGMQPLYGCVRGYQGVSGYIRGCKGVCKGV